MENKKICVPVTEYLVGEDGDKFIYVSERLKSDEGVFGEIWKACENSSCNYILKYQGFRERDEEQELPPITKQSIMKEISFQTKFSKLNISPKIKDSWLCKNGGVIIMKALKKTVRQLMTEYKTRDVRFFILAGCMAILNRLHTAGYYHGDASINNIMVDYNPQKVLVNKEDTELEKYESHSYKYYLIDMGFSGKLDASHNTRGDYEILLMSINVQYDETGDEDFYVMTEFLSEYIKYL